MYAYRVNSDSIFSSFESPFISAILGSRRVGKSTLAEHYRSLFPEYHWVSMNMDRHDLRERAERGEVHAMIEEQALMRIGQGEKIWVIIDEAQKCPALFEQIKIIYDEQKDKNAIKFILTGSGYLELHQLSAESLAGRIQLNRLREFNLKESVILTHSDISIPKISLLDAIEDVSKLKKVMQILSPYKKLHQDTLQDLLIWGGFPEVLQLITKRDRGLYLSDYLQTYLEKDIRDIDSIRDIALYKNLMSVIAEQTGSVRNEGKIIQALRCSTNTVKKYRGYLKATMLYREVFPYIGSIMKRIVKSPKGYLVNNGLVSYLTGISDIQLLEKTGLIGHRFENWFLKEVLVWLDRVASNSQVCYWRTTGGVEVDFIVEIKPAIYPFEVTYGQGVDRRKVKNLKMFMQQEKKAKVGFYVYQGEFQYDSENKIFFIPAWAVS